MSNGRSRCQGRGHAVRGWVRWGQGQRQGRGFLLLFFFYYFFLISEASLNFGRFRPGRFRGSPPRGVHASPAGEAFGSIVYWHTSGCLQPPAQHRSSNTKRLRNDDPEFHSGLFSGPESLTVFQQRLRKVCFSGSAKAFGSSGLQPNLISGLHCALMVPSRPPVSTLPLYIFWNII